jgi:hypothetical protein
MWWPGTTATRWPSASHPTRCTAWAWSACPSRCVVRSCRTPLAAPALPRPPDRLDPAVEPETPARTRPRPSKRWSNSTPTRPSPSRPRPAPPSILDRALDGAAAAGAPATEPPAEAAPAAVPSETAREVQLPARVPAWHPRSWWQRLRGTGAFHPLFGEDFIAPLRPRQVARWVAVHGVGARPLAAPAPQRAILLDVARRRAGDTAPEVELHVITAAVGHDDDRHRLLLSPDGHVIGPRHWSRPRAGAAATASLALLAVVVAGAVWRPDGGGHPATAPVAASASAAAPASAPVHVAAASVAAAASPVAHASTPAPAPVTVAVAAPAPPPSAPVVAAPVPAATASAPALPRHGKSSSTLSWRARPVATAAVRATVQPWPRPQCHRPRSASKPRRGRIELPPLVPRLADVDRHDLRTGSRALRREPAVLPDAKAWALVTPTLTDKRQSERVAAQLQAVALLQPMPMRAELMAAGPRLAGGVLAIPDRAGRREGAAGPGRQGPAHRSARVLGALPRRRLDRHFRYDGESGRTPRHGVIDAAAAVPALPPGGAGRRRQRARCRPSTARRFELSRDEWRLLAALSDSGRIQAAEAAQTTTLDKMQASRALRSLQARGLVSRETDARRPPARHRAPAAGRARAAAPGGARWCWPAKPTCWTRWTSRNAPCWTARLTKLLERARTLQQQG